MTRDRKIIHAALHGTQIWLDHESKGEDAAAALRAVGEYLTRRAAEMVDDVECMFGK